MIYINELKWKKLTDILSYYKLAKLVTNVYINVYSLYKSYNK